MPKVPSLIGEPKISQNGPDVALECELEADPPLKAQWFKDDKEIKEGAEYQITCTAAGSKFKLCCLILNFDKPLAGLYRCSLTNDHGNTAASFTVSAGDAPEFPEKPRIIQRGGGEVLVIKVRVKSKTDPKIEWLKNDSPLKETERIKFVTQKDEAKPEEYTFLLEIKKPQKDDEAKYTAVAKNGEGAASQSLNLSFD